MNGSSYKYFIVFLFFISGITALSYQVLWVRMLSLQFGISIFGVVLAVATFMAGLGLGSLLGSIWQARQPFSGKSVWQYTGPLFIFACLEAFVAVFAFFSPYIMSSIDALMTDAGGGSSLYFWYFLQAGMVMGILIFPATALGLTFPLILAALRDSNIGVGVVYGFNSLGGALGALLPLALLPVFAWAVSVKLIGVIGLIVASIALWLNHRSVKQKSEVNAGLGSKQENTPSLSTDSRGPLLSLIAYGGIGMAALILEVGWTRLFGMILLRTEYVLAVILAVFLIGIALGSLIGKFLTHTFLTNQKWLIIFPISASFFALLSLWGLPFLADWASSVSFSTLSSALLGQALGIAILTLPVTLILGAWFPVLSHYLSKAEGASTKNVTSARLYGANSIGAALGALLAGFVLIPTIGTPATICVAAGILFLCGLTWIEWQNEKKVAGLFVIVLILFAWPVLELPDVSRLLPTTLKNTVDIYRFEDAVSITHVVQRVDGQRLLLGDLQRMDASSDPAAVASQQDQARLPLLLHPQPRSVLFLGLGTGISASGSLPYPDLTRVGVELSHGAIIAAEQFFAAVNGDVMESMEVVRDDARRYLRRRKETYDVIVGDLFHPDLVGRSALLTIQQFQRTKARLQPQGLFVQWIALNQFDQRSLSVVLRTFKQVFPHAVLFIDGFKLALVGPMGRISGAPALLNNLARLDKNAQQSATGHEGPWTWLGRFLGPIDVPAGPVQDEWAPQIEFDLPRLRYSGDNELFKLLAWLQDHRLSVEAAAAYLNVNEDELEKFEPAFTATGLASMSWMAMLAGKTGEANKLIRFAYSANKKDRWIGFDVADQMSASLSQASASGVSRRDALLQILEIRPDHVATLTALLRLAEADGDVNLATNYRKKITEVSPLAHVQVP